MQDTVQQKGNAEKKRSVLCTDSELLNKVKLPNIGVIWSLPFLFGELW